MLVATSDLVVAEVMLSGRSWEVDGCRRSFWEDIYIPLGARLFAESCLAHSCCWTPAYCLT